MIEIRLGNIEEQTDCEAIVNAANPRLASGNGVCGAIYRAANRTKLEQGVNLLYPNGCKTGRIALTRAYDLEANGVKHIIHAVGPKYADHTPDDAKRLLDDAYTNAFLLCQNYGIKSVAVPAISAGIYGYPLAEAAQVAVEAARMAEMFYPELRIVFVVWQENLQAFKLALDGTDGNNFVLEIEKKDA